MHKKLLKELRVSLDETFSSKIPDSKKIKSSIISKNEFVYFFSIEKLNSYVSVMIHSDYDDFSVEFGWNAIGANFPQLKIRPTMFDIGTESALLSLDQCLIDLRRFASGKAELYSFFDRVPNLEDWSYLQTASIESIRERWQIVLNEVFSDLKDFAIPFIASASKVQPSNGCS